MAEPKVGDFVLFDEDTWIIKDIKDEKPPGIVVIEGVSVDEEEEILLDALVSTDIRTWDTEGEPEGEEE